jgi:ABC-2 type transport system ATP-binding protein
MVRCGDDMTSTAGPLALEARGLSKRYGDRDALCDVDLAVRHGQLHGLLGPNGAGKTTLMRILLGLVGRDAGTVTILGCGLHSVAGPPAEGVAGFVETPAFYPYLSGRRNLTLLARLDGTDESGSGGRVVDALAQTGLAAHADAAVAGYSSGMRQRLGLAAALLRAPQLLFLDEPTSALDPAAAREVRALAQRLADQGTAVLLSSHDMAEVEDLCDMLTVLNLGRVVFAGTFEALQQLAPPALHSLGTSDDAAALELASHWPGVTVGAAADTGLEVSADLEALDAYVIALGHAGVAVRRLERRVRTLESLFLDLTRRTDTNLEPAPPSGPVRGGMRGSREVP